MLLDAVVESTVMGIARFPNSRGPEARMRGIVALEGMGCLFGVRGSLRDDFLLVVNVAGWFRRGGKRSRI